jgi:hypothetical protein
MGIIPYLTSVSIQTHVLNAWSLVGGILWGFCKLGIREELQIGGHGVISLGTVFVLGLSLSLPLCFLPARS